MLSTSLFWMYCMLHVLHGIHLLCFICFFPFYSQPMFIYLLAYKYACYSLFKLECLSKWWKQKETENFSQFFSFVLKYHVEVIMCRFLSRPNGFKDELIYLHVWLLLGSLFTVSSVQCPLSTIHNYKFCVFFTCESSKVHIKKLETLDTMYIWNNINNTQTWSSLSKTSFHLSLSQS